MHAGREASGDLAPTCLPDTTRHNLYIKNEELQQPEWQHNASNIDVL